MTQEPSAVFEATYESGTTGLVGGLAVAINDAEGNTVVGPQAAGITEILIGVQPTGTYSAVLTAPSIEGQYVIMWSNDGSFNPDAGGAVEDLLVEDLGFTLPPLGPDGDDAVICNLWTDIDEVLLCCTLDNVSSDLVEATNALIAASELMHVGSGRQFPGMCMRTVRPCADDGCPCGYQVLSRGHLVGWDGNCWGDSLSCDCSPVSRVKLPGYVQSINQVKIDGVVLDPSEYGVRDHEDLIRIGSRWPRCQSTDIPDTELGTFSVTYTYGKAPPVAGQLAATKLACEIVKSCTPGVECALPDGVVRVTREGITIEMSGALRDNGRWVTGIGQVDWFLNTFNPNGLKRTAAAWSPVKSTQFARPELQ